MKKIALFYTPPLELINEYTRIFIELIEENILLKNQIKIIFCNGKSGLNKCVANYRGDRSKCFKCKTGLRFLIDKYSKHINIEFISYSELPISKYEFKFKNYNNLKKLKHRGINIGLAVHSEAITTLRDHVYDIEFRKDFILDSLKASVKTIDILLKIKPDLVYTFNGRVSHYNSIVKYAQHSKIDFSIFEVSANKQKFVLSKNKVLHSVDSYTEQIENTWNDSSLTINEKENQAKDFFDLNSGRLVNNNFNIKVFSKDKKNKNKKLEYLKSSNKKIISIFNSSRNEFECVEGWNDDVFYDDDESLINQICQYFKTNMDFLFVLRVHPNLKFLKNTQNENIKKLVNNSNLIIIYPEEKLSSYELIRLSETIITFGSTIGIESTYMGKKSILIGDSLYKRLDCTHAPNSFEELIEQIQNPKLDRKSKKSTFKYGFYILNNGIGFKFSEEVFLKKNKLKFLFLKIFFSYKYLTKNNFSDTLYILQRHLNKKILTIKSKTFDD